MAPGRCSSENPRRRVERGGARFESACLFLAQREKIGGPIGSKFGSKFGPKSGAAAENRSRRRRRQRAARLLPRPTSCARRGLESNLDFRRDPSRTAKSRSGIEIGVVASSRT